MDATGAVTAAAVSASVGNGFDEAAREAAMKMHFEPAEIDGKPAAIRIEYVMHFRPALPVDGGARSRCGNRRRGRDGTAAASPRFD